MTGSSHGLDATAGQFPLSCAQEMWCQLDKGDNAGAFGPRFIVPYALRISGRVDLAALQGALDDVVARHELLRTVVVRDADPPYQQVYPPCPVPLEVRDLPPAARSRDVQAEELVIQAKQGALNPRELPLLRACLARFDDQDAVLVLVMHHSSSDGWSAQLIIRDLAALYAARTTGRPAALPEVRQYGEFAAWQQARVAGPDAGPELDYWRDKLDGARVFALPTDRPIPDRHTQPYSAHNFIIGAEVMTQAAALAKATRASTFMVLLGAVNVLAHQITGTTDPVIDTLTTGRNEPRFHHTVGPFLNFLALRTGIGDCVTFRDILTRTRDTCLEAYTHEIPIQQVERELPELMSTYDDPRNSNNIFGIIEPQFDSAALQIGDGSSLVRNRVLHETVSSDLPIGLAWVMEILTSGELNGCVQYNVDEFEEQTVTGWVSSYGRILSRAVSEPDREWKTL